MKVAGCEREIPRRLSACTSMSEVGSWKVLSLLSSHGNKNQRLRAQFWGKHCIKSIQPSHQGPKWKKATGGLLPRCDVPGCCLQPSQKLFKRSNQITPWLNLSHILFATSSSSSFARLTVCLHSH